ncbi:MAG: hypothetical protein Q8O89_01665 [Nanoarchaeota archaeon]|nr:hypothetical protein [Nanoarchaeota archaeon]
MTGKDEKKILNIDSDALNRILYEAITGCLPQLEPKQVQEILQKSISTGIKEGIENAVGKAIEKSRLAQAALTPLEREVDNLLIYDSHLRLTNEKPYEKQFSEFLSEYSREKSYDLVKQTDEHRNGLLIRFNEPITEKSATQILNSEGLWLLCNNTRYLIFDGKTTMNSFMTEQFKNSDHYAGSIGVSVNSNLSKNDGRFVVSYADAIDSKAGKEKLYLQCVPLGKTE